MVLHFDDLPLRDVLAEVGCLWLPLGLDRASM